MIVILIKLTFELRLKVLQYFPIQMLMNPYWCRFLTGLTEKDGSPNPIKNDLMFPFWGERNEDPSTEVEEFKTMLNEAKESWKKSVTRESLISTFQEKGVKEQLQKVTKIIAFGLGSLWHSFRCVKKFNGFESWAAQHAVIKEMRIHIKERFNPHVRSFAQDPYYASKDKELLLDFLEIERLEDPDGTLRIDGETLVFAMSPNFPLLQLIADLPLANPPIIFHNKIERDENWQQYKDAVILASGRPRPKEGIEPNPTSPRVEKLLQNYKEYTIDDPDRLLKGENTRLYVLEERQAKGQDHSPVIDSS